MARIEPIAIETERLVLRPPAAGDAAGFQALCDNWNVSRMTARMPHPYSLADAEGWIAAQPDLWASGSEYAFAIMRDGTLVGAAGLNFKDGAYDLGYWIGEPWWGEGLATEAARRLCRLAFDGLKATHITAGHYADNHASARVLAKCGFRYTGEMLLYCRAQGQALPSLTMALGREGHTRAAAGTRQ